MAKTFTFNTHKTSDITHTMSETPSNTLMPPSTDLTITSSSNPSHSTGLSLGVLVARTETAGSKSNVSMSSNAKDRDVLRVLRGFQVLANDPLQHEIVDVDARNEIAVNALRQLYPE